ncbi:hypothetical protein PPL_02523 [Heterostelium album PN500]|uniref:Uncharacterized protein n=1 Tax=Heterostelium pallidum (strain ATCC 26659 / Pp 5 / PN500) TaxID=670386 RepID=D3B2B4_HETP5|nr:hypothetical protein PPL_02523 [Heterostelium album PN500]EFA84489.1 hypothetical protein PPL_02523 [Heterostelium album PN500]|eukprot:XP_020436603.1 hypothetical protein PPL_02523 [Heterostelium album PN500]
MFRFEISTTSRKHFPSIVRRLYRLFAHAHFHHKELYDEYESKTLLCKRFVKFSTKYDLIQKNSLIIKD